MRQTVLVLLAGALLAGSCTPTPSVTPTPTGSSGVKSVTYRFPSSTNATWNISYASGNPTSIIPSNPSFGVINFTCSGSQIVKGAWLISGSKYADYLWKYNGSGLCDTARLARYDDPTYADSVIRYNIEYSGSNIYRIGITSDAVPAHPDFFYFSYSGSNISHIGHVHYNAASVGYDTVSVYKYYSGSVANNFATSIRNYQMLVFTPAALYQWDFVENLPLYVNANLVDSVVKVQPNLTTRTVFTNMVDTAGRLTKRMRYDVYHNVRDTAIYSY